MAVLASLFVVGAEGLPASNSTPWNPTCQPHIVIPNGLKQMPFLAKDDHSCWCPEVESVSIPGTVEGIPRLSFNNCTKLTSVTIGKGVKSIGEHSFSTTAITSIAIPPSVTDINQGAFMSCDRLASATFGAGIKDIGPAAFWGTSLKAVKLPKNADYSGPKVPWYTFPKECKVKGGHCTEGCL